MANTALNKLIPEGMSPEWYGERIAYMAEFMLPERVENFRQVLDNRTRYMTICMENTFHPQNASALIRHCEAFGLQDIHVIEDICGFKPNTNIVRGTDKWINLHKYPTTSQAIAAIKGAGYRIVATTPHTQDSTPETFDIAAGPFALVFGTEHAGISDQVREEADGFLRIPMYGFVESLNVSASAAILLHTLSSRLRESNLDWGLDEDEKLPLLLRWIMQSVRSSKEILIKKFPQTSLQATIGRKSTQ